MNQLSNKERVNSEGISISRFRHCNIGNSLKIEHWKLNIGLSALLFFLWCTQAGAATFGVPSNYLTLGQGLVGHWTFDGPDLKNNVADRSGQGNHGFLTGQTSTTTVEGKLGQAILFDGSNDYVDMNDVAQYDFNSAQSFSLSYWFKTGVRVVQVHASKKLNISATAGYNIRIIDSLGGRVEVNLSDGVDEVNQSGPWPVTGLFNNVWHHVVMVIDRQSNTVNVYVDSVGGTPTSISSIDSFESTNDFRIGSLGNSSGFHNGSIDDARIYNRALRADEIKTLYNSGSATVGLSRSANPADSLSQGLVGHWTFDGKDVNWATGAVADRSGSGNTGYVQNMATTTTPAEGALGQAFSFDGASSRVRLGNDVLGTGSVTISAWVNVYGLGGSSVGRIIDNARTMLYINCAVNGTYQFGFRSDGSTDACSGTNAFAFNKWVHVVATRTSGGITNFYVDGVVSGTLNQSSGSPVTVTTPYIGNSTTFDRSFNGILDDVRVYNRILRPDEVKRLYEQSVGTKQSATPKGVASTGLNAGLVGHWTFDGPDVNWATGAVKDRSGSGNTGYVQGLMSTTTAPVEGKFGQALSFDNVNDTVNMGAPSALNITGAVTVSTWIKKNKGFDFNDGIVGKAEDGGGHSAALEQFSLYAGSSASSARFRVSNGTSNLSSDSGSILRDTIWYHLVGTYDGVGTTKIYSDGVLLDSDTSAGFGSLNSVGTFGISQDAFFGGSIDDVRIYNRALSADEIRQLYTMGR